MPRLSGVNSTNWMASVFYSNVFFDIASEKVVSHAAQLDPHKKDPIIVVIDGDSRLLRVSVPFFAANLTFST